MSKPRPANPAPFLRAQMRMLLFACGLIAACLVAGCAKTPPEQALRLWAQSLARFVATKRGFADALHSGDPAYNPLPGQFLGVLAPRVQRILDAGAAAGTIRADIRAEDLIHALARLADSRSGDPSRKAGRMTDVLLDGVTTVGSPVDR